MEDAAGAGVGRWRAAAPSTASQAARSSAAGHGAQPGWGKIKHTGKKTFTQENKKISFPIREIGTLETPPTP